MHAWAPKAHEIIKILIVDDSPEDREAICEYLSRASVREGFTFDYLETGKGGDGLAIWRAESPDCILLDHHLPDMSGLEFLAHLKAGASETPVPVVMLTGSTDRSLAGAALRAGAQEYLPKQFLGSELLPRAVQSSRHRFSLIAERRRAEEALVEAGALQRAIFNSANFSSIATDGRGVIQIFNVGAERMLGYTAVEVVNKITPADISDPQELIARAQALSVELATPITPGFEALVFKASRGIEDIYELTYIHKDGSRLPAVVSVTALRDAHDMIIG